MENRDKDSELEQTLNEIPSICIDNNGEFKFVLIEGPDNKKYIFGTQKDKCHRGVFVHGFLDSLANKDINISKFRCIGGGKISINNQNKTVRIYDESSEYGKFNIEIVKQMFQEYSKKNLADYLVNIE